MAFEIYSTKEFSLPRFRLTYTIYYWIKHLNNKLIWIEILVETYKSKNKIDKFFGFYYYLFTNTSPASMWFHD